ncbi:hypothetical protein ACFXPT_10660 [Streptomyces goshikiensis]|uniref:hypothetical protein n=1 Tax=Streptomyces goshikiensis TaxID=1942 RepID=UPI003679C560
MVGFGRTGTWFAADNREVTQGPDGRGRARGLTGPLCAVAQAAGAGIRMFRAGEIAPRACCNPWSGTEQHLRTGMHVSPGAAP